MVEEEIIVISLGGSLIVPEEIDTNWLKSFKILIEEQIKQAKKFILISGGGKTARKYQNAAKEITKLTGDDLDWIGIHSTRLNAHLIRTIFREYSHPEIIKDPTQKIDFKEKILVAAGWKPGFSTDFDAVLLAKNFKVKKVINLSNIDYVYTKDPKKYSDAKIIKDISWKEFRKIVGDKWDPGLNAPFDPIAAKESEELGLEVSIMNGKNIDNLKNYLEEKEFIGTIIK
ncbi:UMP kinase [Candidatus Pacearchaeota archaeon]|nr:UMP kinase [Candidatus Pacearchaeota archaeon]